VKHTRYDICAMSIIIDKDDQYTLLSYDKNETRFTYKDLTYVLTSDSKLLSKYSEVYIENVKDFDKELRILAKKDHELLIKEIGE
jgi:hypothetical protein